MVFFTCAPVFKTPFCTGVTGGTDEEKVFFVNNFLKHHQRHIEPTKDSQLFCFTVLWCSTRTFGSVYLSDTAFKPIRNVFLHRRNELVSDDCVAFVKPDLVVVECPAGTEDDFEVAQFIAKRKSEGISVIYFL